MCTINGNMMYMVPEIWRATDRIFCHFEPFFAISPNHQKNKNLEKMKNTPGDIIVLHKCTKNHDHILYCSWDMRHDGCNCYFSFWAIFGLLPPPPLPPSPNIQKKSKFSKTKRKYQEISLFYTCIVCKGVPVPSF